MCMLSPMNKSTKSKTWFVHVVIHKLLYNLSFKESKQKSKSRWIIKKTELLQNCPQRCGTVFGDVHNIFACNGKVEYAPLPTNAEHSAW